MAGEEKPRIFQGTSDMMMSLGVIVLSMLVVVGATGLCTVNPEKSELTSVRKVDGAAFLELEARTNAGAIRVPEVPQSWVANSARRAVVDGQPASVVGWITLDKGYVSAWQTQAQLVDAIANFDSDFREDARTEVIDGFEVTVASSSKKNVRDVWGVDLGDQRVLVTGTAPDDNFRELVRGFIQVDPLPESIG
ncbi:MAG: DUF4245 domain-containing protein [Corynebacterium sp.]|nr:DUF4245 domain-containing protein [Corynebacterium sp.]